MLLQEGYLFNWSKKAVLWILFKQIFQGVHSYSQLPIVEATTQNEWWTLCMPSNAWIQFWRYKNNSKNWDIYLYYIYIYEFQEIIHYLEFFKMKNDGLWHYNLGKLNIFFLVSHYVEAILMQFSFLGTGFCV